MWVVYGLLSTMPLCLLSWLPIFTAPVDQIAGKPTVAFTAPVQPNASLGNKTSEASKLWLIDGLYYDLEPLLLKHPGGQLPLLQGRGRDVSVLFQVHHLGTGPIAALKKYKVDGPVGGQEVQKLPEFSFKPNGFYMTLKGRVREALQQEIGNTSARKPTNFYMLKLASNIAFCSGSWMYLALYSSNTLLALANAASRIVLLGFAHDAVHTALMPKAPSLQALYMEVIFRILLQNHADVWHREHLHSHHPYTKTYADVNENLDQGVPLWRLTNVTPWAPRHSFPIVSHLAISAFQTQIMVILEVGKTNLLSYCSLNKEARDSFIMVAAQVFFHFLPFFFQPWRNSMKVFMLTSVLPSIVVSLAFHSSHGIEQLEYPHQDGMDWGEYQLRTTCGFQSSGLSGTLDSHIEHHLFPMLSNPNQHFVQHIVKETAKEFDIPYYEHGSIVQFLWTHLNYMVKLGHPRTDKEEL